MQEVTLIVYFVHYKSHTSNWNPPTPSITHYTKNDAAAKSFKSKKKK